MGKILQILIIESRDLAHAQTFCTRAHADWLFTTIIVTWTYEDLFRLVTNALKKALVF